MRSTSGRPTVVNFNRRRVIRDGHVRLDAIPKTRVRRAARNPPVQTKRERDLGGDDDALVSKLNDLPATKRRR